MVRSVSHENLPRPGSGGQDLSRSSNYSNSGNINFCPCFAHSTGNLFDIGRSHSANFPSANNVNYLNQPRSFLGAPPTLKAVHSSYNYPNKESVVPSRQGLSFISEGGLQTPGYCNRLQTSSSMQGGQGNSGSKVQGRITLKPYIVNQLNTDYNLIMVKREDFDLGGVEMPLQDPSHSDLCWLNISSLTNAPIIWGVVGFCGGLFSVNIITEMRDRLDSAIANRQTAGCSASERNST